MNGLRYSLFDFPDNPSELNWKNEAILFYYYMMKIEDEYKDKINKIFEDFKEIFANKSLLSKSKQKDIFTELKAKLIIFKSGNDKLLRYVSFLVLITSVITKLEETLLKVTTYESSLKKSMLFDNINEDYYLKQIKKAQKIKEKSFEKAINETIRITRTESWRYVNEVRLEEFIKKGYKFKTTYPVKDDRTGEDSWFYYDTHQVKPIHEPFSYVWKGKERVFMTPPDRPNDRNILIPYLE